MKRVIICSCILFVIVISSIIMIFILKSNNLQLTQKLDDTLLSWHNNEDDETLKKVEDLQLFWGKYCDRISFIVQSDKIEHISTSIAKLKPLLECGNDEFYSECESIRYSINSIYDSELPRFHSVI